MKLLFVFAILMYMTANAQAGLIPINNDGVTVDSNKYLMLISKTQKLGNFRNNIVNYSHVNGSSITYKKVMFPARSNLTAGKVNSHPFYVGGLTRPIFVIGDDSYSIFWAKENAKELIKLHALGFITNVNDLTRVKLVERKTHLTLIPANLDGLNRYLPVRHYPFLWTSKDIEQ